MKWISKFYLVLAAYSLGALATFGHESARFEANARARKDVVSEAVAGQKGLLAALVWPGYWPFRLSWEYAAQGMETQRAKTAGLGPKDDSPVPQECAPTPTNQDNNHD